MLTFPSPIARRQAQAGQDRAGHVGQGHVGDGPGVAGVPHGPHHGERHRQLIGQPQREAGGAHGTRRRIVPPGQGPRPAARGGLNDQVGGDPGEQVRHVARPARVAGDRLDDDVVRARHHGRGLGRTGPADQDQAAHRPGRRQAGREPLPQVARPDDQHRAHQRHLTAVGPPCLGCPAPTGRETGRRRRTCGTWSRRCTSHRRWPCADRRDAAAGALTSRMSAACRRGPGSLAWADGR